MAQEKTIIILIKEKYIFTKFYCKYILHLYFPNKFINQLILLILLDY